MVKTVDSWADYLLSAYATTGRLMTLGGTSLLINKRLQKGKEIKERVCERYGIATYKPARVPFVWVHAASVGETNLVMPVIHRMAALGIHVIFTTTTVSSARLAQEKLPPNAVHQFAPFDIASYVDAFLDCWRPELVLFVESEIWPVTIMRLKKRNITLGLLNARLSLKSFNRWLKLPFFARAVFGRFTFCLTRSESDAHRLRHFEAQNVVVTGNLKYDTPPLRIPQNEYKTLQTKIGVRPVWIAASTHLGEEQTLIDVHERLLKTYPNALLVLAPRHAERGFELSELIKKRYLECVRRSTGDKITPTTKIYIADTFGELGLFYKLARVVFTGGSIVPHGGQNPIEAAQFKKPILHGVHTGNFTEIYTQLNACKGAVCCETSKELETELTQLLKNKNLCDERGQLAYTNIASLAGPLDKTLDYLMPYLNSIAIRTSLSNLSQSSSTYANVAPAAQ